MGLNTFSPVIAGTMGWGRWGKRLDTAQMAQRIRAAVDLGITTFDHADIYGDHSTEAEFGAALRASGVPRGQVQLISKCGIRLPGPSNAIKHYDHSREHIVASVERSLQHLGTDHLDLLLLHRPSPLMDADEVAATVQDLIWMGKIRAFGVSNFAPATLQRLHARTPLAVNQIECSLAHCAPLLDGQLDTHQHLGIATQAWAPLGGLLTRQDEAATRVRTVLNRLAPRYGAAPEDLLLAWLARHPAGIRPVLGTTEPERLRAALHAMTLRLDTPDWFELLQASQGNEVP
ncbi:aldo/keto reductase [Amphibiibacter pelophylacis]|uniref:Aldo/keto reductase n=1 Tax=Amphibiibacter pelophylacis TaxID=1799477 RepID=A0ACC6P6D5_9BURK